MSETMWHYAHGGATHGPLSHADLCSLFANKDLPIDTHVWNDGMDDWVEASVVEDFRGIWGKGFAQPAHPPPLPSGGGRDGISPVIPVPASPLALPAPSAHPLRPMMGLGARDRVRADPDAAGNGPQVRPWIRYWARAVDTSLLGAGAVYLFSTAWPEGLVYFPYILVGSMILHPIQVSMLGTTFGKALFGISLRTEQGEIPSLGQAASREFSVLVRGLGLNLLVLPLITMIVAYRRLKAEGVTSWDRDNLILVRHKPVGLVRWCVWLLVLYALPAYILANGPGKARMMEVVDALKAGRLLMPRGAATAAASASQGTIRINVTTRPTTGPAAAKTNRPKPRLLTLPSQKAASLPPIKSNSPATRPIKRSDRPPSQVIFKPDPPPES